MSHLIDTTEMYLRTVYELLEEGIAPLRARIAERLHHSGPTVSETVARMERDGLLTVGPDRQIHLSDEGMRLAVGVMRRHRLAERLLTDVIGLDWHLVHEEACRWEHVMSDVVEARLVTLLEAPEASPYGNPIPEADAGPAEALASFRHDTLPLSEAGAQGLVVLRRISEHLQQEPEALEHMHRVGVVPGATVRYERGDALTLTTDQGEVVLDPALADRLFVSRAAR
ncbi:MAG TPA: metal-dependent transcriptional regulator [Propionibacteriaceae bacterium]|nr:metal-dependent transcriptional regulator [Propionibacteriaceae bacterium]HPZ50379.1 metal-dependent transcriptional regulator [Propionibacteriaceae bacterium]HQE31080.1 metal-dependent transcriptional regulator [Propionibacteriaceae bacterium]